MLNSGHPATGSVIAMDSAIHIFAFENVSNASEILEIMDETQRFAVVDLSLVCSKCHLLAAAFKSLQNEMNCSMKTKTISTEILYQLASTTKINEAISQYGLKSDSKEIAFIFVDSDHQCISKINGTPLDLDTLSSPTYMIPEKIINISRHFKITPQELEISPIEDAILTRLATKDCL